MGDRLASAVGHNRLLTQCHHMTAFPVDHQHVHEKSHPRLQHLRIALADQRIFHPGGRKHGAHRIATNVKVTVTKTPGNKSPSMALKNIAHGPA